MRVLVVNSGSSTIKFSMFDSDSVEGLLEPRCLFDGELSGIGGPAAKLELRGADGAHLSGGRSQVKAETPVEAIRVVLDAVCAPPSGLPKPRSFR